MDWIVFWWRRQTSARIGFLVPGVMLAVSLGVAAWSGIPRSAVAWLTSRLVMT